MMTNQEILAVADACDGHSILCPESLLAIGLDESIAIELTDVFESDLSSGKTTIHVDDLPVNHLRGIGSLDLLERLATYVNADRSGVVAHGRGTRARQLNDAIRTAIEGGATC